MYRRVSCFAFSVSSWLSMWFVCMHLESSTAYSVICFGNREILDLRLDLRTEDSLAGF